MKNETKNTKMNTDFFNYTSFEAFGDDLELAKEAVVGIVKDGKFTGIMENGGSCAGMFYFINGEEVTDDYTSEDDREYAVLNSVEGLEDYYEKNKDLYVEWNDDYSEPVKHSDFLWDGEDYYFTLDLRGKIDNYLER